MRITEQLHRRLLTGEIGSSIVECITGWGIILAATGCYLWWPKTSKALKRGLTLSSRGSRYQVNWRLHNVLGAWFGFILLLLCLTGMVFSTYAGSLYQMAMRVAAFRGTHDLFGIARLWLSAVRPAIVRLKEGTRGRFKQGLSSVKKPRMRARQTASAELKQLKQNPLLQRTRAKFRPDRGEQSLGIERARPTITATTCLLSNSFLRKGGTSYRSDCEAE